MRERQAAEWRGPGYRGVAARRFEVVGVIIGGLLVLALLITAIWGFQNVFGDKTLRVGAFRESLSETADGCIWTVEVDFRTDAENGPVLDGIRVDPGGNANYGGQRTVELPAVAKGAVTTGVIDVVLATCPDHVDQVGHGQLEIRYREAGGPRQSRRSVSF